jgi:hypothetical protein
MNDSNYRFIGSAQMILCDVLRSSVALIANQQLPFAFSVNVIDDELKLF